MKIWIITICICLSFKHALTLIQAISSNAIDSIILSMLKLNSLPQSQQIGRCFTPHEAEKSGEIIAYFISKGSEASSSYLLKLPALMWQNINQILTSSTIQCLAISNDLGILLKHYNVTYEQMGNRFSEFSHRNFLRVHYYFTNMSEVMKNQADTESQKYQKLGKIIHSLCSTVFHDDGIGVIDDPWIIRAEQVETLQEYYGISVSNGVIGAVSSKHPFKLASTVLAGVYDKIGRGRVDNLVQTYPALNLEFSFNGNSYCYNYAQQLSMKDGSMTHSLSGSGFSIQYTYYTLRNLPFVFFTKLQVSAHEDGEVAIKNLHEAPDHLIDINMNYEQIDSSRRIYSIMSTIAKTKTGRIQLAIASSFLYDGNATVLHESWDSNLHLEKIKKKMKKGESFLLQIITCLISSEHHEDPQNQAIRLVIRASSMTDILLGHTKKWNRLWESDIIIEGNDADQKNVRSMLYHCYSFLSEEKAYGVSPMGLSGLGYNGHVFWDMDLWIYPAILVLRPSLAKSMVEYRFARLKAAIDNAFVNGYAGAMFPWESSKSGVEQTPVWALSGPLEHHISGCVAFGAWNYYLVTQDKSWLRQKGYPILESVAEFFASRVEADEQGNFHIRNVVAADEWAQNVDDDAFTNAVAKVALRIANKAAIVLNISQHLEWDQISDKIVILKMSDNVTREHSTYAGEPIKQADVNLLSFPLKLLTKAEDILRDLKYYQTRVPDAGTPAMTFSIFCLLYSRLKYPTQSYKYFKESFSAFLKKPFNVFSETKGGTNPYFLTGAGGVLQSMVFGFGGYDIADTGLQILNTSLPKQWTKVIIKRQKIGFPFSLEQEQY